MEGSTIVLDLKNVFKDGQNRMKTDRIVKRYNLL